MEEEEEEEEDVIINGRHGVSADGSAWKPISLKIQIM